MKAKRLHMFLMMIISSILLTVISMAHKYEETPITQAEDTITLEATIYISTQTISQASAMPEVTRTVEKVQERVTQQVMEQLPTEPEQQFSTDEEIPESVPDENTVEESRTIWRGEVLNPRNGTVEGPSGKETYYNLDMSGIVKIMKEQGYDYEYHIREDGVKMLGPYIMCAANLDLRPRGTIVETSLGTAIVCDTGDFAKINPMQLDIAVDW